MCSAPSIPGVRPAVHVPLAVPGFVFIALCWGVVSAAGARSAFAELGPLPIPLPVIAAITIMAKVVGVILETAFYWTWWSAAGAPVRFGALAMWIAAASLCDLGSECTRMAAVAWPDAGTWLMALGGPQIAREVTGSWPPFVRLVLGAAGVLTLLRILITARGQAREAGRRLRGPLALTLTVYAVSRVLVALSLDVLRGGSPV